ncbi:MAG: potassium channel protein [Epsilonproteobacteria bacterium]|nr:potassium channel protein [Campylobacterota bacterium]
MSSESKRDEPLIISFFLYLAHSPRYIEFKNRVRDLLKNPKNRYKQYIDYFLIFLIVSSVAIFMWEVEHPTLGSILDFYATYFTSFVFLIEYLINLWLYNDIHAEILEEYNRAKFLNTKPNYYRALKRAILKKLSYMITIPAIIDLLAILPAYREFRFLKVFVLFRFLKLLKHSKSIYRFLEVIGNRKFELLTLFVLLIFVVFIGGLAIYILEEKQNENIHNLFDALYWSFITITTVGYGDIAPVTSAGRMVSFVIVIMGITMISFSTSVIVSAFSEKLTELKEERVAEQLINNKEFLIVCGYGQISKIFLREYLKDEYEIPYIVLDKDCRRVQEAINDGHNAICDDASRYEVLNRFYTPEAKITLLALTGSDIENIYISLNAKSVSKDIDIIARASSHKLINRYKRAGADRVVLPYEIASSMLVASIVYPTMYKAINAILNFKDVATIDEIYVSAKSLIINKTIEEVDFKKYNITIFGVQHGVDGEFIFNPPKSYRFKEGDIAVVMGHRLSLEYFKKKYNIIGRYRW